MHMPTTCNHAWYCHTNNWLRSLAVLAAPLSWLQLLKELLAHTTQGVGYSKEMMILCSLNQDDNIYEDFVGRGWAIGDMLLPELVKQLQKVKRVYEKCVARQLSPAQARFARLVAAAAAEGGSGTQGRMPDDRVMEFGRIVQYTAVPKIFK